MSWSDRSRTEPESDGGLEGGPRVETGDESVVWEERVSDRFPVPPVGFYENLKCLKEEGTRRCFAVGSDTLARKATCVSTADDEKYPE